MCSSVVPAEYKERYGKDGNCGDEVAQALAGIKGEALAEVATRNGIDFKRWEHLNPGMQRMNLGNMLRARGRRGDKIVF